MKTIALLLLIFLSCFQTSTPKRGFDRERDGFIGPVEKVFVEWTPVSRSYNDIQPGKRCRHMTNVYDEVGRLIQHSVYPGSCGSEEIREDYTYAEDGSRIIKSREVRASSIPAPPPAFANPGAERETGQPKEVFQYDSSGRQTEVSRIRPSGKTVYKYTYSYDAKGRLIEIMGYDADGKPGDRRVYSYEGDERVPSNFTYYGRDGKVYERTVYTDYEFNSRGDWIKRKEFTEETLNRKSTSLTYRNVEYYEHKK